MLDARLPQWRGRDRLLSAIAGRTAPGSLRGPVEVSWGPGLHATINPSTDGSLAALYRTQWVRPALVPLLESCLRTGDTFIDVGANIGLYSSWASRIVGPTGHVMAFEPVPATRAVLQAICVRNELANLEIHPLALGASAGEAFIEVTPGASGLSRIVGSERTELAVEVAALDDAVGDRSPSLIKVDVEGHEFGVMQGGQDTLQRTRCPVVFESPVGGGTSGTSEIVELLSSFGYDVYSLGRWGLSAFRRDSHSHNLLAIHASDDLTRRRTADVPFPRNQNN